MKLEFVGTGLLAATVALGGCYKETGHSGNEPAKPQASSAPQPVAAQDVQSRESVAVAANTKAQLVEFISSADSAEFSKYPATVYKGPIAAPHLKDVQLAMSQNEEEVKAEIAHATPTTGGDKYIFASGCGTECAIYHVVLLPTGYVSDLNAPLTVQNKNEEGGFQDYQFRPDSNLVKSIIKNGDDCVGQRYVWLSGALQPIGNPIVVSSEEFDKGLCPGFGPN